MSFPTRRDLDLVQIAKKIKNKWKQENTFLESIQKRANQPTFYLYEGPPSANGKPGIHHAFTRTIKDIVGRYKTMKGFCVPRKSGWDTHGLPIEIQVEKELQITKKDVGKSISIEAYNKRCRETVLRYQKAWTLFTETVGYWTDLDAPYMTCSNAYISSVWHLLKLLYEKDLLYEGYSIQPYSPAAGTGLSSHELNQPGCYRSVTDVSVVAQFQMAKGKDRYLLAWTTTPWTLPAHAALAVNKHLTYVEIETINRYTGRVIRVVLAEKRQAHFFEEELSGAPLKPLSDPSQALPWRLCNRFKGAELLGESYQPLYDFVTPTKRAFVVVHADFVSTEEGTGVVHLAPSFGADDQKVAQQQDLDDMRVTDSSGKRVPIVDLEGRYRKEITPWANAYVKKGYDLKAQPEDLSVDQKIGIDLKNRGRAFLVKKYAHNYPHCWRTHQPIIYYPLHAWFIRTTAKKERLVALNKQINWYPEKTGSNRFGKWLEHVHDWNLSRSRFWGTPLPIWRTEDKKESCFIGSIEQLREEVHKSVAAGKMKAPLPEAVDLHRPYIDEVVLVAPSGAPMYRVPDLIDVWFDAGSMPYAQSPSYPTDAADLPTDFPANFIAEGIDQTRGWFFTLHVISVLLFDQVAYKNVLSTGLVLDKNGQKMSKSLGNTLDPLALLNTHGPDVLRWYMIGNNVPWENLKFDPDQLIDVQRKFFGTLQNTYQFFALYASIDQFVPSTQPLKKTRCTISDRWILSKLQHLIQEVTKQLDGYLATHAVRALENFVVDDLSNWYIRQNRSRFWRAGHDSSKETAYQVVHCCLKKVAQLAAPIAPFYMEQLYSDLHPNTAVGSVHHTTFPTPVEAWIDNLLETHMGQAQRIVSLGHALRKKYKIKVRQPLQKLLVAGNQAGSYNKLPEEITQIILQELNLKELVYVDPRKIQVVQQMKPNFKRLGSKLGKEMAWLVKRCQALTQEEITRLIEQGCWDLVLPSGQSLQLVAEDWIIHTKDLPGWAVITQEGVSVALDLNITPALQAEGWARMLVHAIQNQRKVAGFSVDTKINICFQTDHANWKKVLKTHQKYIKEQIQAVAYLVAPVDAESHQVVIDEAQLNYTIEPVSR